MKEWIVCEDNCLKCSYGATLDCDGDCPRCPRNTYCPCVTFVSFAAGKLAPVAQPVTTTFERPRQRAQQVMKRLGLVRARLERWDSFRQRASDLAELASMAEDPALSADLERELAQLTVEVDK